MKDVDQVKGGSQARGTNGQKLNLGQKHGNELQGHVEKGAAYHGSGHPTGSPRNPGDRDTKTTAGVGKGGGTTGTFSEQTANESSGIRSNTGGDRNPTGSARRP